MAITSSCKVCIDGYGLISSTCMGCKQPHCINCDTNLNGCNICAVGYGKYTATNSQDGNSQGSGTKITNKSYNASQICNQCNDPTCNICPTDITVCAGCIDTYGLTKGKCVSCTAAYCLDCNSTNLYDCTFCMEGYGLILNSSGKNSFYSCVPSNSSADCRQF
jgi:hypothetical protein